MLPVTVAPRSKAWTVFARWDAGIVDSNPTQGMDVWRVYAFILCLGTSLATDWSLVQRVLRSVKNDLRNCIRGLGPEWAGRATEKENRHVSSSRQTPTTGSCKVPAIRSVELLAAGRAIAQAVSCRFPTAAARVLRFLLPIFIPPTAPHSSSIVRDWYNRPVSGRRIKWTHCQSHSTPRNLKKP
jgi:hypothetical protein